MELAEIAYAITRSFPDDERFGLTSQIRRAAVSVAANIAEGHSPYTTGDLIRGLRIANGSLKELETHCLIAARTGTASGVAIGQILDVADQVGRRLRGLRMKLELQRRTLSTRQRPKS